MHITKTLGILLVGILNFNPLLATDQAALFAPYESPLLAQEGWSATSIIFQPMGGDKYEESKRFLFESTRRIYQSVTYKSELSPGGPIDTLNISGWREEGRSRFSGEPDRHTLTVFINSKTSTEEAKLLMNCIQKRIALTLHGEQLNLFFIDLNRKKDQKYNHMIFAKERNLFQRDSEGNIISFTVDFPSESNDTPTIIVYTLMLLQKHLGYSDELLKLFAIRLGVPSKDYDENFEQRRSNTTQYLKEETERLMRTLALLNWANAPAK